MKKLSAAFDLINKICHPDSECSLNSWHLFDILKYSRLFLDEVHKEIFKCVLEKYDAGLELADLATIKAEKISLNDNSDESVNAESLINAACLGYDKAIVQCNI